MLVLKLALQILAVAAALLTATLNYVARDKRTHGLSLVDGALEDRINDLAELECILDAHLCPVPG